MYVFCVYCEGVFTADTQVCPACNEYDGLSQITYTEAKDVLIRQVLGDS